MPRPRPDAPPRLLEALYRFEASLALIVDGPFARFLATGAATCTAPGSPTLAVVAQPEARSRGSIPIPRYPGDPGMRLEPGRNRFDGWSSIPWPFICPCQFMSTLFEDESMD